MLVLCVCRACAVRMPCVCRACAVRMPCRVPSAALAASEPYSRTGRTCQPYSPPRVGSPAAAYASTVRSRVAWASSIEADGLTPAARASSMHARSSATSISATARPAASESACSALARACSAAACAASAAASCLRETPTARAARMAAARAGSWSSWRGGARA
eukprot:2022794-Prymnesium_polylepis.1